jgi:hypothetical protein
MNEEATKFQGWYCVIEDYYSEPPWVDIRLPKDIDPEKFEGDDLELVKQRVCNVLGVDYSEGHWLAWEKRHTENEEADIYKYELFFVKEGGKLCVSSR